MDVAEVRAELEEELTHRLDEIRFFRNQLDEIDAVDEKERYCKCLIVMLYAHFEGFWKAAFSIYLNVINQENIKCKDAIAVWGQAGYVEDGGWVRTAVTRLMRLDAGSDPGNYLNRLLKMLRKGQI